MHPSHPSRPVVGYELVTKKRVLQNQSRLRQSQQQELLRQMRPDVNPQYQQMMRMQNGGVGMANKGLVRAAMANNQNQYVTHAMTPGPLDSPNVPANTD